MATVTVSADQLDVRTKVWDTRVSAPGSVVHEVMLASKSLPEPHDGRGLQCNIRAFPETWTRIQVHPPNPTGELLVVVSDEPTWVLPTELGLGTRYAAEALVAETVVDVGRPSRLTKATKRKAEVQTLFIWHHTILGRAHDIFSIV